MLTLTDRTSALQCAVNVSPAPPIRAQLIGTGCCVVDEYTTRGHAPTLAMCRQLIAAGYDPKLPLEAYRGDVLAIRVKSIGRGAKLTVEDDRTGRPRFGRFRKAAESCGAAPLVRQNGSDLSGAAGWVDWPPSEGCA